jgi:hypothetical protein
MNDCKGGEEIGEKGRGRLVLEGKVSYGIKKLRQDE